MTKFAFSFTHFSFLFCSNFLPILLFIVPILLLITHVAFHDEVMLHKFAAPILSAILVDLNSCCSHQQ